MLPSPKTAQRLPCPPSPGHHLLPAGIFPSTPGPCLPEPLDRGLSLPGPCLYSLAPPCDPRTQTGPRAAGAPQGADRSPARAGHADEETPLHVDVSRLGAALHVGNPVPSAADPQGQRRQERSPAGTQGGQPRLLVAPYGAGDSGSPCGLQCPRSSGTTHPGLDCDVHAHPSTGPRVPPP